MLYTHIYINWSIYMIINIHRNNNSNPLPAGTVVSTGRPGYRHYGIVTDRFINGFQTVISNTGKFRKVVEEPLPLFQEGSDLRVEGYWGKLHPHDVLSRARAKLGAPYSLFTSNCEHFVRFAHGLREESPQVQFLIGFLVIAGVMLSASRA